MLCVSSSICLSVCLCVCPVSGSVFVSLSDHMTMWPSSPPFGSIEMSLGAAGRCSLYKDSAHTHTQASLAFTINIRHHNREAGMSKMECLETKCGICFIFPFLPPFITLSLSPSLFFIRSLSVHLSLCVSLSCSIIPCLSLRGPTLKWRLDIYNFLH